MTVGMINANPVVHERPERAAHPAHAALDALDVFDTVRDIKDPEHPYSLEQLSVLSQESVSVDDKLGHIQYVCLPASQIWIYARDKMIIITDDELPYMILSRLYLSGDSDQELASCLNFWGSLFTPCNCLQDNLHPNCATLHYGHSDWPVPQA
uniref:Uncharacterized protein n=1 Tax=Aegilops tauschii subsp. strangulata TaxID=200361 RepID=A0A453LXA2_AEGTS